MTDETENQALRLIREIQEEAASFREEMRQGFQAMNGRFDRLEVAAAAISADLKIVEAKVDTIAGSFTTIEDHMNSIEGHLTRIEKNIGLVKA